MYTLPELPYDCSALAPVLSPEIIDLHHDKHHAAYVKGANDTLEQPADAITEAFGSFAGFKAQLSKTATTTRRAPAGVCSPTSR